jgi:pSer/pThr/pTyr-binding forkhead associated (FHA) protein
MWGHDGSGFYLDPIMANRRDMGSPVLLRLDSEPAHMIRLDRPLTIVGSKLHSHLRIVSQSISGSHALLLNLGNQVFLRDLMSRTHAYVNDRELNEAQLKYGDVLRFGEMRFRFVDADVIRQSLAGVRSAPAELRFQGHEPVLVDKPLFVLGRQAGADLVLGSSRVSKAHAVLYMQGGGWMLRDLGSREGTLVNGTPIRTIALRGGEIVRIGRTSFTYVSRLSSQPGESSEATAPSMATVDEVNDPGEAETDHVFIAEPEVVDSESLSDDRAPTRSDPISEFLAQPMGHLAGGLDLDASEHVEDARDLVEWGVVAQSPIVTAPDPLPEHPEAPTAEDLLAAPSGMAADVDAFITAPPFAATLPAAHPGSAAVRQSARTSGIIDRVGPVLSEPVDLDATNPSADAAPTAPGNALTTAASNAPDTLAEILGDQVLTLYSAQPRASSEVPSTSASGAHRRSRPALALRLGTVLLALVAAAAGGAWFYMHRS